jgi:hypothetical protein
MPSFPHGGIVLFDACAQQPMKPPLRFAQPTSPCPCYY